MKTKLAVIFLFVGFLDFATIGHAGFLSSSDPINIPKDRFQTNSGISQSSVSLDTEYIIHGGDVGSTDMYNWPDPSNYWKYSPHPKFVEFYLKLANGKWILITKNEATPAIQSDYSIERFAFIFSPKEFRRISKENPDTGNRMIVTSSRDAGVIRYEATFSYEMNRRFEDNLVSLYSDRGCIVQNNAMTESNFVYMQCGCKNSSSDRSKYGYSFCTSHFNKEGEIDVESIQAALKEAGGLNYVISKSNIIEFKGVEDYWVVVDAAQRKKAQEDAEKLEAASYQADKLALLNATTKENIEAVIKSLESWKLRHGILKEDQAGLLLQAKQKLAPYLQAENKQREFEAAQQVKEDAERQTKERQQLASFRKFLTEGGETNCGPVIESKEKLVKIAFAVAGYGNEHWIRREEAYPSGYGCRFVNGQYQPPQ